uniref:Uncharacterized protein n=1 Tax=viral metagenome TaxID=1070528 RepID=A0A6C0EFV8_9ZZZZ
MAEQKALDEVTDMELEYKHGRKLKPTVFDEGSFVQMNYRKYYYEGAKRYNQNKCDLMIDTLENKAVKKLVDVTTYPFKFTYVVPATEKIPEYDEDTNVVTINGQTLDLDYYYIMKKGQYVKYDKIVPDKITFENDAIKLFDINCYADKKKIIGNIFTTHDNYNHYDYNSYRGKIIRTDNSCGISEKIEIRLNKPSYVSHIATAKNIELMERKYDISDRVPTVNLEKSSWVEEFELLYKDMKTKNWRSIGKFVGNTEKDETRIKLNEFDMVYTDKILFSPLKVHKGLALNCCVALFGLSTDKIDQCTEFKKYDFELGATRKLARKTDHLKDLIRFDVFKKYQYKSNRKEKRDNLDNDYANWKYEQTHIVDNDHE